MNILRENDIRESLVIFYIIKKGKYKYDNDKNKEIKTNITTKILQM